MAPPRKKQKLRGNDGKFVKAETQPTPPEQQQAQAQQAPTYQPPSGLASQRLLDTFEIVETILLNLSMRDLLLATRVSKTWHNLIYGSIALRRALFFEPVACGAVSYLDWRYDDKAMYPEALKLGEHVRGPKRNRRPNIYPRHWGKGREDAGQYQVFVNPLLAGMFPVLKQNGCYFKETLQDLPAPARYVFSSWRRMYFTQPPVGSLVLEWDSGVDPAIEDEDEEDEDEDDDERDTADWGGVVPVPTATNPTPTVPVPATPGLGGANGAGAGNAAGNSRGDDADWTLSCFSKWTGSKGMCMEDLFYRLEDIGCPAWSDGRDLWEEYRSVEDLGRVVVGDQRKSEQA